MRPTVVQFLSLGVTALFFMAAFVAGWRHMRRKAATEKEGRAPDANSMGVLARVCMFVGAASGLGLLAWRSATNAVPLSNDFDAFLFLSLLLTAVLVYLRWTRSLRALSFFLIPLIVLLLLLGGILAAWNNQTYDYRNVWTVIHVGTVIAGSLCFSLGFVGGAVYIFASRQLKKRSQNAVKGLPSLASIERFTHRMVHLGFPLLTVAMAAGAIMIAQGTIKVNAWYFSPKVVLAAAAWVIYAMIAYVPVFPSFRGQRAAWLSIVGFVLFIGGYIAANWIK